MPLSSNYSFSQKKYIIDANINRFKEGARVLEDLARFVLQDEKLFTEIRKLRHTVKLPFVCRSAQTDIGGIPLKENNMRGSILDIANANAIRMQEAARVLEEIYSPEYKTIRFNSYKIHDNIITSLKKFLNLAQLKGVYVICDIDLITVENIINIINNSNITLCQVRSKNKNKKEILEIVNTLRKHIKQDVLLIVNDHLDIALTAADGVHLGQSDFPLDKAKELCPENFIIGISCHNLEQAIYAEKYGANYISVGCIFQTTTKKDTVPVSIQTLHEVSKTIQLPLCAIGGINCQNINELITARINMIAVSSCIWNAKQPNAEIIKLSNMLN